MVFRAPSRLAVVLGLGTAGCLSTDPPGEQIGVFDVRSDLQENTCGPTAVVAGDQQFAVEIRRDRETVYWQYLGGQPLVGRFVDTTRFEVELGTQIPLYGEDEAEQPAAAEDPLDFISQLEPIEASDESAPGCTLVQEEVLEATVDPRWLAGTGDGGADFRTTPDAGTGEARDAGSTQDGGMGSDDDDETPALTGRHVQTLTPTADSDCSRALGAQGGPFEKLPCTIRYSLSATRRP